MAERWRGIFTILVTPFHNDLAEIDHAMALARRDVVADVVV